MNTPTMKNTSVYETLSMSPFFQIFCLEMFFPCEVKNIFLEKINIFSSTENKSLYTQQTP